ncbi:hypothetical protein Tco_0517339 [Tanacetum coccineum]
MDDPNMTMKDYIKFEEEKAHRRGRVFNWQTATYGKIRVDDNLRSIEAEFLAIVINNAIVPQEELRCKSQVSTPVNDESDFRISFDESDDEDYTILFDKNSFSYKMIYVNDLKTDSENNNEKVTPSIPSTEPAISCFDDLDFFKDFENEFPAIVYNDAQTSKSDLLTEPILSPQHIDEFDLKDETSLSEYDEEEQNILYFNDLFPFNVIHPDDLKSEKDNDNNEVDTVQSSVDNEIIHGSCVLSITSHDKVTKNFRMGSFVISLIVKIVIWRYYANGMLFYLIMNLCAPFGILFDPKRNIGLQGWIWRIRIKPMRHMDLPPREQRRRFFRYERLQYTVADVEDFESRLARIYQREVHRVQVFNFRGLPDLMAEGLSARMLTEHRDDQGLGGARRRMSWREFILARGLYTAEEMQTVGFGAYWVDSARHIPDKGDLKDYWIEISSAVDFLDTTPSYTMIRDTILRLYHRYLRLFVAGRKSGAHIYGGKFVARLAQHFRLLTAEILGGLTVIALELQIIDMAELVRLQICVQLDDTWAWVAMGPERQPVVTTSAPADAEDVPIIDEGGQVDLTPVQTPQ